MTLFTPDGHLLPLEIFRSRLAQGADPNEILTLQQGDEFMAYMPLLEAVKDYDRLLHLKALLEHPRLRFDQTDYELRTAVHLAAEYDNPLALGLLLDAGFPCNTRDCYQSTPLHYAAIGTTHQSVLMLLGAGADPNPVNCVERSPLHECLMGSSATEDKMILLLACGADPDQIGSRGNTVLHAAAELAEVGVVRLLLAKGANARTRNHAGLRPVDCALLMAQRAQRSQADVAHSYQVIARMLAQHDRDCLQVYAQRKTPEPAARPQL